MSVIALFTMVSMADDAWTPAFTTYSKTGCKDQRWDFKHTVPEFTCVANPKVRLSIPVLTRAS